VPTTECIFDLLQGTTAAETDQSRSSQPVRKPCGLERLPMELLDQISDYLPIQSVLAMHQTSRMLALKVLLDNNFWRKSIISGRLLPYIWDFDVEELDRQRRKSLEASPDSDVTWDWRVVGQLLATKHFPLKSSDPRIVDLPNGLWNRRRIWSIVADAYKHDFLQSSSRNRSDSVIGQRKRRQPVFDWQLEEIMDDLGHYS
jgi:hypothetical protein